MINYAIRYIFEYDEAHPEGSCIGFKEEDKPNFIVLSISKLRPW